MTGIIKRIGGWVAAALITVILGITFQTQNVLARLENIGADVSFVERLSMTLYDIQHLGSLYIIFVSIALAVAFLLGGLVYRFAKFGRPIIYMVAGGAAILVMLFAMKVAFFDVHLIAGARDAFGIGLQMLAGAIGGFVFAKISRSRTLENNV
jgi:hypothetical protein